MRTLNLKLTYQQLKRLYKAAKVQKEFNEKIDVTLESHYAMQVMEGDEVVTAQIDVFYDEIKDSNT